MTAIYIIGITIISPPADIGLIDLASQQVVKLVGTAISANIIRENIIRAILQDLYKPFV